MIRNCNYKDRIKLVYMDVITCMIIMTILLVAIFAVSELFFPSFLETMPLNYVVHILFFCSSLFKDVIFKKQSFSEKIMKVKIIDEKTNERPSAKKLIFRNIFFITYITLGIDLIFCFKRLDNRTLGDIVSKTRVVYSDDNPKSKEFKCD